MSKDYEQQILDWEQEIDTAEKTAEKTIISICGQYIQLKDIQGTTMSTSDIKEEILFSAYLIRKNAQDQKDLIKEGELNGK